MEVVLVTRNFSDAGGESKAESEGNLGRQVLSGFLVEPIR
jgi:hypothetical protein